MRQFMGLVSVLMLFGCASWNSPWGILSSKDDPPIVAAPSAPDAKSASFVITTKAEADPRIEAQDFCAKRSRYARLTKADRAPGADPARETITWHFDCTY